MIAAALAAPAAAAPPRVSRELRVAAAPGPQLDAASQTALPGDDVTYRFQHRVGGLRVLGSQAVVYRTDGAPPRLVADSTEPSIAPPASPTVGRERAIDVASAKVGVTRL